MTRDEQIGCGCLACSTSDGTACERRASPAAPAETAPTAGDWWCPRCKEALDGSRVTYQERCDTCGSAVEWVEALPSILSALSSASATEAALRAEVERLTRDREATDAVLREACAGSEPSAGHTLAEEVAGLLRVTRGQRDDARTFGDRLVVSLRAERDSLAGELASEREGHRAAESREAALRGERDEARSAFAAMSEQWRALTLTAHDRAEALRAAETERDAASLGLREALAAIEKAAALLDGQLWHAENDPNLAARRALTLLDNAPEMIRACVVGSIPRSEAVAACGRDAGRAGTVLAKAHGEPIAPASEPPASTGERGGDLAAEFRAVYADMEDAARFYKEGGATDALAVADQFASWVCLALAGRYLAASGERSPRAGAADGEPTCVECGCPAGARFGTPDGMDSCCRGRDGMGCDCPHYCAPPPRSSGTPASDSNPNSKEG